MNDGLDVEVMSEETYRPPEEGEGPQSSFHVLSGCSGSGKSSLLAELERRGYETVGEPGRQIVKEQLRIGGDAFPWKNSASFVELCASRSMYNFNSRSRSAGWVFFDRGIVDALVGLDEQGASNPDSLRRAACTHRYGTRVFMTPPWREIFRNDRERRHSFEDAVAGYEPLLQTYEHYGYEIIVVPRVPVSERADFVLRELNLL